MSFFFRKNLLMMRYVENIATKYTISLKLFVLIINSLNIYIESPATIAPIYLFIYNKIHCIFVSLF